MAQTILTMDMVTREAVRLYQNSNAFLMNVDRQYDESFGVNGAKIGDSLRIRYPNDYVVSTGPALSVQDTSEQSTTLVLATQKNVGVAFSMAERTLKLQDYSTRILAPAVNVLAASIAVDIMSGVVGGICNLVASQDASGNIINPDKTAYLRAKAALHNNSAPPGGWKIINSPDTEATVVSSLAGLLNPQPELSKQYMSGEVYAAFGFTWYSDQTVLSHTTGTLAQNSATVNGAGQTGTTLVVNALAGNIKAGDILTVAGVYATNRLTKQTTGKLMQFVARADAAVGATSISIYPAIVPASADGGAVQYQTVTASPADGAAVNPALGLAASTTYRQNFAFSRDAATMVVADMEIPEHVAAASRVSYDGLSLRMVSDYYIGTDKMPTRLDALYGYTWLRPEWAVIVADTVTA